MTERPKLLKRLERFAGTWGDRPETQTYLHPDEARDLLDYVHHLEASLERLRNVDFGEG